jgi:hypothetical protein
VRRLVAALVLSDQGKRRQVAAPQNQIKAPPEFLSQERLPFRFSERP